MINGDLIRQIRIALFDGHYALDNIISARFDDPDDPCEAVELCGHELCEECGCLKDKRARIAAAKTAVVALEETE